MTEELTESPSVKELPNGDNRVVSDDMLQHMRRGLFGKSGTGTQDDSPSGANDIQESSNGSADTDDSMKNGISIEDKEAAALKQKKLEEAKGDSSAPPEVEEVEPQATNDSSEGDSTPVVEEPADEPMEEVEEQVEQEQAGPSVEIEIEEVSAMEVVDVPVIEVDPIVVEPPAQEREVEQNVPEVAEVEENLDVEVPEAENDGEEGGEDEAGDEDEEEGEEEHHAVPDDPAPRNEEECQSPPPTPDDEEYGEEEEEEEQLPVRNAEDQGKEVIPEEAEPEQEEPQPVEAREEQPPAVEEQEAEQQVDEEPAEQPEAEVAVEEERHHEEEDQQEEEEQEEVVEKTPRGRARRGGRAPRKEDTPEAKVEEEEKKTPASRRGARRSRGQKEPEQPEEEEKEEEAKPTPSRSTRRGKTTRGRQDEEAEKEEEVQEEQEEEKPTPRRGRAVPKQVEQEEKEDVEKEDNEEEQEAQPTPKRGSRRGKAVQKGKAEIQGEEVMEGEAKEEQDEDEKPTPRRGSKRGQTKTKKEETEEAEAVVEVEEKQEEAPTRSTRRSTRGAAPTPVKPTPRGKRAKAETEIKEEEEEAGEVEEEVEDVPNKRTLRGRGAQAEVTTPKSAKATAKSSARSRFQKKAQVEVKEEEVEDFEMEDEDEPVKETPKTPKSRAKKGKTETPAKKPKDDPYDMDTQIDLHPDPLKNVVVSEGLFGSHKYGKIGSGKYTFTERAAGERIANLPDLVPKTINRRSLADLTPGRRKHVSASKATKSAPPARKGRKKSETDEEMDVDQPGSSSATPTSRKRKPSPDTTSTGKKAKEIEAPALSADEQWIVDHPPDEHAPIEIGARVYAVFNKIYYPAVVVDERDGLGRYKVKFVEDAVVRDIPAQGIVPLRAVVAEKECYYGDDGAVIVACPNAASASEWTKAVFTIRLLNSEGEVKGNDVKCAWSKLSLDMNDWKDYIHLKSLEATSVAADNIALSRTRRSHVETPKKTPTAVAKSAKKSPAKNARKGRAKGDEEEEAGAEENAESEGEEHNIFEGMVFLLTSAQRDGNNTFKKKMLVDFIVERGGLVVEDFNEMEMHNDCRPFLISDTYYRTHKYLSALAKGVPCVSHEWIHKCIEMENAVAYSEYILPAGTSSIDNQVYPAPRNQNVLLRGKNVLIYSGNANINPRAINYFNIWEPLVTFMGGRSLKQLSDMTRDERLDIVLTDNTVQEAMLDRADRDDSWVVTSEWLINAIIMDRLPHPDEFHRFRVSRTSRSAPSDPE